MHPNCRCSVAAWMDRAAMEREVFQNSDKPTEDLSARRVERLAARRKRTEETDFSSMDAGQLKSYIDKNLKTTFKGLNGANTDYIREAVKVIDQLEKALGVVL